MNQDSNFFLENQIYTENKEKNSLTETWGVRDTLIFMGIHARINCNHIEKNIY